jgi:hypothetical protein
MRTRMDDLGRDLSQALERAERESKRNRFLSDPRTSIEFDELLDRVLDAAARGARLRRRDGRAGGDGGPATGPRRRGLTAEEAAHPPSSGAGGAFPPGPITGQLPLRRVRCGRTRT